MARNLRKEKLREPICENELERRWKTIREAMAENELDCLIMQNSNLYLGGYVRYFTDIPAENGYPVSVIFPLDNEMILISHGGPPLPVSPPEWSIYGVKEHISIPYLPTLNFTNTMDAKATVKILEEQKMKSIGFVAKASMSAAFHEYIEDHLPQGDTHDATDLVDTVKAVKSEEEIKLIRKTAEMQDKVWGATLALVRPGLREYELRSEIQRLVSDLGSEEQLIMIGSAPAGTPAGQKTAFFQNRTLKYGDQVCIMIEVNGPGGFYCEIARTVCIGKTPKPLLDIWQHAVEAQDRAAELMRPGTNPRKLLDSHNKLLASRKYPAEGRLFAHGQGYDLVERPGIRPEETMTLKAGMNMAIHPITLTKDAYAFCCDNYLITDSGTSRLHKTAREVFVV